MLEYSRLDPGDKERGWIDQARIILRSDGHRSFLFPSRWPGLETGSVALDQGSTIVPCHGVFLSHAYGSASGGMGMALLLYLSHMKLLGDVEVTPEAA